MFSIGEQVQIVAPGWMWDGQTGEIVGAWPQMGCSKQPFYIVLVRGPAPDVPRRYSVWQSELRPVARVAKRRSRNVPT